MQHRILPNYTYEDYVQWQGEWEIIDGIPWSMRSRFEPRHQAIAGNLMSELRIALKPNKQCKVYAPIDYKLDEHNIFNPDVLVVCKPITKKFLDFLPEIVAEILSDSTHMKDRNVKYPKYEAEGVPYYLMVDAEKETVEVYRLVEHHYVRQPLNQDQPFIFELNNCRFELVFNQIWE